MHSGSLFLLLWCYHRVNISVCSSAGHFRSFSNSILRNRGVVLAVHQIICLLLRWTSGITFFGTGSSYKSFGKHLTGIFFSVAINMLALLCEVDMVLCAQSHVAPPAAESSLSPLCRRLYLQREGDVSLPPPFLPSGLWGFFRFVLSSPWTWRKQLIARAKIA